MLISLHVSLIIPNEHTSPDSGGVVNLMKLFIHSAYVSLGFNDLTAAIPSTSQCAFFGNLSLNESDSL